jgi:hypothetical protein
MLRILKAVLAAPGVDDLEAEFPASAAAIEEEGLGFER